LSQRFESSWDRFDRERFAGAVDRLEELSLMQRVERIGTAFGTVLPSHPEEALEIMRAVLPAPLPPHGKVFNDGYWMLPLAAYWPIHHPEAFETSMVALAELTQRGTAEFAVRPLIERHPDAAGGVLERWSTDESFHVRRLASEGSRPRLPWKGLLRVSADHARRYFSIIWARAHDDSRYVRRSVGNHARDMLRVDADLVRRRLAEAPPAADVARLVERASRSQRPASG
jgi:3-methyladenine DNA glycosylase AlkC